MVANTISPLSIKIISPVIKGNFPNTNIYMMGDFNVSDEGRTQISIYTTKYDSHAHRLQPAGWKSSSIKIKLTDEI